MPQAAQRVFRSKYREKTLGPFLTTLQQKRAEVLYHIRRLEEACADPSTLAAPGGNSLDNTEFLTAINAEFNAAMHVLRTMLDVAAQIANVESALKLTDVYLHSARDRLSGAARTAADSLLVSTEYLRDFDNRTKHERIVGTGAREHYDLVQGEQATSLSVAAFEKSGRKHPPHADGLQLVHDTYNVVVDGVCDLLDAL